MLVLTCSSKLATLRRLLAHSFPESLKACGALHHVIIGNPFKLEVLVDQWPDVSTVICRPSLEYMKDPSDHYTNTYFLFSKNLQNLRQMLEDPRVVNWKQDLQIQGEEEVLNEFVNLLVKLKGCQPTLGGVLQEVSSKHGRQIHTTSNFLYMRDRMTDEELENVNSIRDLQYSSLVSDEAHLVNALWGFGGNERSERYLSRCIQSFPTVCMRRGGVGAPLAWVISEQSAEMRVGYTDKLYRGQGVFRTMIGRLATQLKSLGTPLYCHVTPDNKSSQAATLAAGFPLAGRWQQWNFKPL